MLVKLGWNAVRIRVVVGILKLSRRFSGLLVKYFDGVDSICQ